MNAHVVNNVAQGKPATQRTTRLGASNAVSGTTDTPSCTMADTNTWWAVDLEGQYDIATVNVTSYTSGSNNAFGNYYPRCYITFSFTH